MNIDMLKYVVFMKVGYHADESLSDIIDRKRLENEGGTFYWGYGGTLCHPLTQIQPFAKLAKKKEERLFLLMSFTPSKFIANPIASTHFSIDKKKWELLPANIHVTGSKYSLICNGLKEINYRLNLNDYIVAIGPQKGTELNNYLRSRVDKACAIRKPQKNHGEKESKSFLDIQFISEIVEPYSVFVSNENQLNEKQLHLF